VRKILIVLSLSAAALAAGGLSGAAFAQAPAGIAAGMSVKDTNGGEVGTVARVESGFVIVKTDKHEVRLPANSFTPHEGSLLFGLTQAQLNAEVEKSLAAAAAKIAPGAAVTGTAGAAVGTITAVDDQTVTIKLASGNLVRVPKSGVAAGPNGVVVVATAADLEAAGKPAAPAPAPTPK
jgi:preprotein translocase subunit YajC